MGLFEQFPYSNFHEMNLDWLITQVKNNESEIDENKTDIDNINKEIEEIKSKTVEGVNDSQYVNIMDFVENIDEDITTVFNDLYSKGHRYFYFPAGTYHIKFTECVDYNIKGDGKDKTIIKAIPNKNLCAMYVDAMKTNIKMEGFTLTSPDNTTAKTMHGFRIISETGWLDLSTFKDIKFTGFATGFYCEGRAIWNSFYGCEFYGNYGDGLKVDGVSVSMPFNNNNFYSCRFSNNRNYGIFMRANTRLACLNTVFYGCNIEANGYVFYEWGGSDADHTILFKTVDSAFFIGCYFEYNSQSERNAVVWFVSDSEIYINNCTFVTEWKPIFTGDNASVYLYDSYGTENQSSLTLYAEYADFSVNTNCYQLLGIKNSNSNTGIQTSSSLNFAKTNTIKIVGNINISTVTPSTITLPVYIITGTSAPTLDASIMEDGNALTLEQNSSYSFYLIGGKLRRIK